MARRKRKLQHFTLFTDGSIHAGVNKSGRGWTVAHVVGGRIHPAPGYEFQYDYGSDGVPFRRAIVGERCDP